VERPNKEEYEKAMVEIDAKFEKLRDEKRSVHQKIEGSKNDGKSSEIGKHREAMNVLKAKKQTMINEKKDVRAQLDSLKVAGDKLSKERKDTRSSVKFGSVEEIEKEIKKLQRLQETTSMSLGEEKKLLKEIDGLLASKDKIKDLKSKELDFDSVKAKRNTINASIKAKDKEIDAVTKEMDEVGAKIKGLAEKHTDKRSAMDGLFKDRDRLNKEIKVVLKEKDGLRDTFREQNNAWYNYQRAYKAQKQIEYEAEKKTRDEERQAHSKKMEEEELKKIPYEAEQTLCDYLADYLERTYLNVNGGGSAAKAEEKKKGDVIAVTDDPFASFKPMGKKDDDVFFSKGKEKKKRQRQGKKQTIAGPFILNVDSFEQFGLVSLTPPHNRGEVEQSVKDLREKKEWFKKQPRGSVPTSKDIRKQNEKAAAKLRQGPASSKATTPAKGKFSLSNDEFVPLGKGASAGAAVDASSSWGQKPVAAAVEES
jgi:uncharacterized coiled-coil DUF342 family protein